MLQGEVVASAPKSLMLKVMEGDNPTTVTVEVGLGTQFIPFRRPAVGEKVKVQDRLVNGVTFGNKVTVVDPASQPVEPQPPEPPATGPSVKIKTLQGEVVASTRKALMIMVMSGANSTTAVSVTVGLRTQFFPFRRPAVGEKVEVEEPLDNGLMTGHKVRVIQ